jgi:hypothetical protein
MVLTKRQLVMLLMAARSLKERRMIDIITKRQIQLTNQHMTLVTEIEEQADNLNLNYSVSNNVRSSLYLFNVLHDEYNENDYYPFDKRNCYVEFEGSVVVISKKIMSTPPNTFVERLNIPFVTPIPPGSGFSESFSVALPLREHSPYLGDLRKPHAGEARMPVVFEIGYFVGQDETEALIESFQTDRGPRKGFDPFPISSQLTARAGIFPPVRVTR